MIETTKNAEVNPLLIVLIVLVVILLILVIRYKTPLSIFG